MAGSVECSTVTARVAASAEATRDQGATACRRASRSRRSASGMWRTSVILPESGPPACHTVDHCAPATARPPREGPRHEQPLRPQRLEQPLRPGPRRRRLRPGRRLRRALRADAVRPGGAQEDRRGLDRRLHPQPHVLPVADRLHPRPGRSGPHQGRQAQGPLGRHLRHDHRPARHHRRRRAHRRARRLRQLGDQHRRGRGRPVPRRLQRGQRLGRHHRAGLRRRPRRRDHLGRHVRRRRGLRLRPDQPRRPHRRRHLVRRLHLADGTADVDALGDAVEYQLVNEDGTPTGDEAALCYATRTDGEPFSEKQLP